ncbi:phage tail protein [Nonomuraea angiospora]|uniref:hypothetical protein n=1 Tax=Nonomuraea angiospora TaxID=46172 RepID=UPI0029AC2A6B|nr:hypothetical protein [Nonomuraea angiospora]MDX3100437.1 hypothetical protein [Nonomuraea angiospora]
MPVNEKLMELGSWQITLVDETPKTVLDKIEYFGHIAFVSAHVEPGQYNDQLLDMARYVGVVTARDVDHLRKQISGQSTALWLGDADGKGDVLETPVTINGSFAQAIRAILGTGTAVVEGALHPVPGTYRSTHVWQSKRKAVAYVCATMGAEWRVTGSCKLDAGLASVLYEDDPSTVIVRKRPNRHTDGDDMSLRGLRGDMGVAQTVADWTSRVVLLAEGNGSSVVTAAANNPDVPYRDLRGQPVKRTRVISESATSGGNAQARAQYQLDQYITPRSQMRLTTDDYDVSGAFKPGDWAWVYDPDTDLIDPDNEIMFRGELIHPVRLRMVGASWPVRPDMTVAYRGPGGEWLDLTPYVAPEGGQTTVDVGDLLQSLSGRGSEPVGPRPIPDSTVPAPVTWVLPFESGVYIGPDGTTRARMLLRWQQPLNSDGSTILDGAHFEIEFGVSSAAAEGWQTTYAAWGSLQTMVLDLTPGLAYDWRIRAVDASNNRGQWSTVETAVAQPDTIPPSTPAAPTVAASLIAIQVTHTLGAATGGEWNLEADLDHLEVHVGATPGFAVDETTLRGKIAATVGMMQAQIPAVGTVPESDISLRQVKVVAVDGAGNRSLASAAAPVTTQLIDSAHITSLTVDKVAAGEIKSNWILGANIATASSGQRVELNASGLHGYNSGGLQTIALDSSGSFSLRSGNTGGRIELDNSGVRGYSSTGAQTFGLSASSGNLDMVGRLTSNVSGSSKRLVINPNFGVDTEIRFYEDATQYHYITSYVESENVLQLGSITTDNKRFVVHLAPTDSNFVGLFNPSTTQVISGLRFLADGRVSFAGAGATSPSGAFHWQVQSGPGDGMFRAFWNGSNIQFVRNDTNSVVKTFIIDHPSDSARYLVHATTESPVNGTEYWGEVQLDEDGTVEVELPAYFEDLTSADGRAVFLSCRDVPDGVSATYPVDGRFTISGTPGRRVFWLVKAARKDVPPLMVEPLRTEVDIHGSGPYRFYTIRESHV